MEIKNFDLGVKESERYGLSSPCCVSAEDKEKVVYPSFRYVGPKNLHLSDEGTMTIKFRKTRNVEEEKDGKSSYECEVEVREIVDATQATEEKTDTGSILDGLMKAVMEKKSGNSHEGEEY
jgi:hypothetical protein